MLNAKEMKYRIKCACDQNVPVTNYGMTIAYIHGVLERSLKLSRRQQHCSTADLQPNTAGTQSKYSLGSPWKKVLAIPHT